MASTGGLSAHVSSPIIHTASNAAGRPLWHIIAFAGATVGLMIRAT
jgi:hypothetical protein